MVLLLIERWGGPERGQGSDGYTPLHVAAQAGRTQVVRLLLDRGADVNLLTHGRIGAPALHLAEARGRTEVAQMLREGGATAPPVEPIATLMAAASAERGQVVASNCTAATRSTRRARRRTGRRSGEYSAARRRRCPTSRTPLRCNGSVGGGTRRRSTRSSPIRWPRRPAPACSSRGSRTPRSERT